MPITGESEATGQPSPSRRRVSAARSAQIDFLRGVAIFAVLLLHFSLSYDLVESPASRLLPQAWVRRTVENGNYGVTIFFVISGYLITSNNLLRFGHLRRTNLRQFYAYRFSRIIPPLILALAVIVALGAGGVPSFMNRLGDGAAPTGLLPIAVLSVLTFWHNILMEVVGYFNYCMNIYWSLSVEEVFYLTFPAACVLLKRNRYIIALCVLAIAAGPVYRALHRDNELFFMYGYAACFDAIAFGCLAALLQPQWRIGRTATRVLKIAAALALGGAYFAGIEGHEAWGFSAVAISCACLLVNAFESPATRVAAAAGAATRAAVARDVLWWPAGIVCWFGKHSYELYLFHIILLAATREWIPVGTLAYSYKLPGFALFLAVSALLAGVVSRYFAEPLNAGLRHHWTAHAT